MRKQDDLAAATGLSVSVISLAERGRKVDDQTLLGIEVGLKWPTESTLDFLRTGDETVFETSEPEPSHYPDWLNVDDSTERQLWDLDLPEADRWWFIQAHRLRGMSPPPSSEPGSNAQSA